MISQDRFVCSCDRRCMLSWVGCTYLYMIWKRFLIDCSISYSRLQQWQTATVDTKLTQPRPSLEPISKPTTYRKFPILIRSLDLQMQARNYDHVNPHRLMQHDADIQVCNHMLLRACWGLGTSSTSSMRTFWYTNALSPADRLVWMIYKSRFEYLTDTPEFLGSNLSNNVVEIILINCGICHQLSWSWEGYLT